MTTPSEPTDTPLPEETSKRELPFDRDDLTYAPDDVVENSDADPDAESDRADDDVTGTQDTPDLG